MAAVAGEVIAVGAVYDGEAIFPVEGELAPIPLIIIREYGYRMRAYDETLGRVVYWTTIYIDKTGAEYTGPGPLTDIIVSHVIGT